MIYNTASVFLAGLISMTSAASVQHAPKSHNALMAGQTPNMAGQSPKPESAPYELVQNIKEKDYPQECFDHWKIFNYGRCWCHTGCALDCDQGGTPGIPAKDVHPEWCSERPTTPEECKPTVCDLVSACKGVDTSLVPGIGNLTDTAGITCEDIEAPQGVAKGNAIAGFVAAWEGMIEEAVFYFPLGTFGDMEPNTIIEKSWSIEYNGKTWTSSSMLDYDYYLSYYLGTHDGEPVEGLSLYYVACDTTVNEEFINSKLPEDYGGFFEGEVGLSLSLA